MGEESRRRHGFSFYLEQSSRQGGSTHAWKEETGCLGLGTNNTILYSEDIGEESHVTYVFFFLNIRRYTCVT